MEVDTEELPPISPAVKNEQQSPQQQPMNMNGDDDPFKPEGSITLKIENLSEFVREGADARRLSEPLFIRGLPWKILAIPREIGRRVQAGGPLQKCLGYFLQCNADNIDQGWNCAGSAVLKILSQKEGKEDHVRKISHVFHAKENDWGFAQFMTFEALMDPESGWYDEATDSIILMVDVTADAPHGMNWDSKKDTGCIGLKNQGATCYMNSILQTLFFTNKLRKAVCQMPTEDENLESSVALAMQRVFYELQFSDSPVGTKKLTQSFGWDSIDPFLQHDVQEFCRVLLDNLESKMKNTKLADTIPSLFKGRMKSYIKCKEVDFESSREECFYDLQLNVKNKSNVLESFRDYIEPEILDGENKYDAGEYGLQPAEKGLKFLSFPPVLHLQLMRFQYDPNLDANVKINDRFEFPDVLELHDFAECEGKENDRDEFTYLLHAVLVHSGDFHGGHYVAFINTNLRGPHRYCKFDDDVVSRVAYRDAVTANFGGENPEGIGRSFSNAYMLVYIKKNAIDEVLCQVSAEDIPEHLKVRFESEKKRELEKRQEKEEANNYCEITLILDEEMKGHHEFELFDPKMPEVQHRKMKVQKSMTYRDLYKFVGDNMKLPEKSFRLWDFQEIDDRHGIQRYNRPDSSRPRYFIDPNEQMEEYDASVVRYDRTIYLEMGKLGANGEFELKPYNRNNDILVFLKFFNHESGLVEFKGTLIFGVTKKIDAHFEEINQMIGQLPDNKINLYIEHSPSKVERIKFIDRPICNEPYLLSGIILIAEQADIDAQVNEQNKRFGVQEYFRNLYNQIEVEVHINLNGIGQSILNSPTQPIRGKISLDWNIPKACSWLGQELDYDYDKILLWKVAQPSEKPFIYLSSEQYREYNVRDLLNLNNNFYDPRQKRIYKMFYTKLPFEVLKMEERKHLNIQMMHDDFQITEISVFPRKHGTVQDVLDEAKAEFKFNPNGSGVLRLVYVYSSANISRVFHVLKEDQYYSEINDRSTSSAYQFRVEEIPKDQLELAADEHLFPVAHFDKDPCRMFGVPFLIKISEQECFKETKEKLKRILHVNDKEFEKYKFHVIMNNRIWRDLGEGEETNTSIENLNEFLTGEKKHSLNIEPYLGIDHFNKMRGVRGGFSEKAIVIHN